MKKQRSVTRKYDREYGLDLLKMVCAFLVVYIHTGKYNVVLSLFCNVAVPTFFVISGYLYEKIVIKKENQIKQIRRLLQMLLISFGFYCVTSGIIKPLLRGASIQKELMEQFSIIPLLKLLFLNATTFGYHLWYLDALLYVLIIALFVDRYQLISKNKCNILCAVLFFLGISMRWIFYIFDWTFRDELVRNFLFMGIPLFWTGRNICKMIDQKKTNIKWCTIIIALLILEQYIYGKYEIGTTVTLMTSVFAVYAVLFMIDQDQTVKKHFWKLKIYGGDITTTIYIIHLFIIQVMDEFGIVTVVGNFALSMLIAYGWEVYKKYGKYKEKFYVA